ncbi:hypothetical protein D7W82_06005 [Corallococcus sp. CA049B]|nr:hypothetical protein D7W82_06005 [Corallococcus sp. CA049B]
MACPPGSERKAITSTAPGGATVQRLLTRLSALEATDGSRLLHAHGRATDAPGHLRAAGVPLRDSARGRCGRPTALPGTGG